MPSAIYWGGLWEWGLRRLPIDLGEYARRAAGFGRYRAARDDDGHVTDPTNSMWARLPPAPEDFLDADITFRLRSEEAAVLVESIRLQHPDTLLASLCTQPHLADGCKYPWDVNGSALTGQVAQVIRHARCFSELTAGPQYVYNVMVARRARHERGWDTAKLEESQLARLQRWVRMVDGRHGELHSWANDLSAFWRLLHRHRIRQSTRDFITGIVRSAVDNPGGFAEDPGVQQEIRLREMRLKGRRARLSHRAALENWNHSAFGGQLEYRWSIAKNYLGEIATALQADP